MAATNQTGREPAKDQTIYWTLSFYIAVDTLAKHTTKLSESSEMFVSWLRRGLLPHEVGQPVVNCKSCIDDETKALRQAIDPLFNDVADRSRLGKIDDFLFAGLEARDVSLTVPDRIEWMTEGKTFIVEPVKNLTRTFKFRSFWYVHGNGSLSWHAGFAHCYAETLKQELKSGPPVSFYMMSLLQKLAWPKEFDPALGGSCEAGDCTTDRLVGVLVNDEPFWRFLRHRFNDDAAARLPEIYRPFNWTDEPKKQGTNAVVSQTCGQEPAGVIGQSHDLFDRLIETGDSIEVPGLRCADSRSCFFIHDKALFELIQPRRGGKLVGRSARVLDDNFIGYPSLIENVRGEDGRYVLDDQYWTRIHQPDAGCEITTAHPFPASPGLRSIRRRITGLPNAADRLCYLFLAGFNQNIMDFMNQEASEVLDSLDPIYPKSEEQEAEGFFIRYANPRSMITYVPRSRTLEVGNDFIGTCPYAFLIHVLSMHNEALTRSQERATFEAISEVMKLIPAAPEPETTEQCAATYRKTVVLAPIAPVLAICHAMQPLCKSIVQAGWLWLQAVADRLPRQVPSEEVRPRTELEKAEQLINDTRLDAFRRFDQHRYVNPFRYDTERDVFEAMEQLRGTSRLKQAYQSALEALDEQTRDIQRIRKEQDVDERASRERRLSYILSFFGFTGMTGLILSTDDFLRKNAYGIGVLVPHPDSILLVLLYWIVPAILIYLVLRLFGPVRR
ncbi:MULTISPECIES: hypothetical protein [Sphingobium]|uniref:hypothetical protein n=1 Tax=Sphingobium sp. MI1205 TaxID=407020 RepID=UPI00076FF0C5|nr:hypothetical protein [Sphingobium sp. MI1205]AMK20486.1 hypothetical protein K663_20648 [Sphingobium sp. MI1205]